MLSRYMINEGNNSLGHNEVLNYAKATGSLSPETM